MQEFRSFPSNEPFRLGALGVLAVEPKRCGSLAKRAKNAKTCWAFGSKIGGGAGKIWPGLAKEESDFLALFASLAILA